MANVLIPSLVRLHFPDRIGLLTALYTTALAVGLTASFLLTVPVADALGGWRYGIGVWAVLAAVAALPWFGLVRRDQALDTPARDVSFGDIARTRLGWAMTAFFGLQSLMAYAVFGWFATLWRDAGYGAGTASALVGIVAAMSIPLSLLLAADGRPGGRPAAGARAGDGLLPDRLRRPDRRAAPAGGAVGGDPRHGPDDLPDRADLHRPAHPDPRGDRRALGLDAVDRLPDGRARARSASVCCTTRRVAGRSRCSCWPR